MLTEWCRLCGFEPAEHHRLIIEELERVARGECDRLAIVLLYREDTDVAVLATWKKGINNQPGEPVVLPDSITWTLRFRATKSSS